MPKIPPEAPVDEPCPCLNGGQCVDVNGDQVCACPAFWTGAACENSENLSTGNGFQAGSCDGSSGCICPLLWSTIANGCALGHHCICLTF